MKNTLYILILSLWFSLSAHADNSVELKEFWIAEAPPVSKVQAGYVCIYNNGDINQSIVSATSDDFSKIEFHQTVENDGMTSMQQQESLAIPANTELKLKPGGFHMMLFNPNKALREGDKSVFQFTLADGTTVSATAVVKKASYEPMDDSMGEHDHHDHQHHNH